MTTAARLFLASSPPGTSRQEVAKKFSCARSSLYYTPVQPLKDEELRERIVRVMAENDSYGYRRVADELDLWPGQVQRVMRMYGLQPKKQFKKRRRPGNTGPDRTPRTNLIDNISPVFVNYIWVGDFTELRYGGRKKLYLASILDAFTRQALGWSMGKHHTAQLITEALEHAYRKRGIAPWIFHSDQGSEYKDQGYETWLVSHGIRHSFSPKGKPWKNGKKESFYGKFKLELGDTRHLRLPDLDVAVNRQFRYYNEKRIHSALHMSPDKFFEKYKDRSARDPRDASPLAN